ncbi:hypothetical protein J19TS2_56170 [Cohnella xylanilytica]|uniref:stalk domain-containing protein n=1 Tax=Cohnella xylanilytica TaxID=557555 RepID=UPI001AFF12DC|nr:stalk domain-containing protein [Cohnella xylanilytica]GIO16062.1 hypothetical protein J19TS2_56170 [Cohnella xylanilytica]
MKRLWGRKAMAAALAASLLAAAPFGDGARANAASADSAIRILLDNVPLPFDSAPKAANGVTLVPFRAIAEALGIAVVWDPKAKTIRANGPNGSGEPTSVVLRIGSKTAEADGAAVPLLAAPVMQNGRILIPLAFFGRQFGAQVGWDAQTRTVSIRSPQREMRMLGFYALSSYGQIGRVSALNSVAFGWGRIDENSQFTVSGIDFKWPQPAGEVTPEKIVEAVNSAPADTYLMVYSENRKGELTKLLSDKTLRDESIEKIAALAAEKKFGGIMLDYEELGWKDDPATAKKLLNEYVSLLADKVKPSGIRIGLALHPLNGAYKGYDYATLGKLADEIVVMAYNYHSETTPEPNDRVDSAIRLALDEGVPKEKLLLGINVHHENETSVGDKLGLAKRYGLSGAAFWRLGLLTEAEMRAIDAAAVKEEG